MFLNPCSNIFLQSCLFLIQCSPRDQRFRAFSVCFQLCLSRAEISPDSLNLLVLWLVNSEILNSLELCIETLFLNCWTICPHGFSPSDNPCLQTAGTFEDAPIKPVNCSKQVFFEHSTTPQSLVAPILIFLEHFAGIKFRMSVLLPKNNKVYQFEHQISCLCCVFT